MFVTQMFLCVLIFAALGVRIGWSARLGLLVPLAAGAAGASACFTVNLLAAAALFALLNAAAQGGFVLGAVTAAPRRLGAEAGSSTRARG